jgi:hydroxymethylbilane synthase
VVSSPEKLRIASRGSELALWQANHTRDALIAAFPALEVEIEIIRTTGDKILDVPLAKIGDRGLFTKEIDEALLDGRADFAVHSLKDVPTRIPDGLVLGAVGEREDPRDALVCRAGVAPQLGELPPGARVGTSSLRRRAQLQALRPDLEVVDLRGNLNTRLEKLDRGDFDAAILAVAGLVRLGWRERISAILPGEEWLPAVGQGALAIVAREEDAPTLERLRILDHGDTAVAVAAERAFLRALEGGCQVPIGALALREGGEVLLDGLVAGLDGRTMLREQHRGPLSDAASVGTELADRLLARGAGELLAEIRRSAQPPGIAGP